MARDLASLDSIMALTLVSFVVTGFLILRRKHVDSLVTNDMENVLPMAVVVRNPQPRG